MSQRATLDAAARHYAEQAALWAGRDAPELASHFAALAAELRNANVDAKARVAS